jgi:hypothetical protein
MTQKQITTADLHKQLDEFLASAEHTRAEDFWEFVGTLGQLCGVADRIDESGRDAQAEVSDVPGYAHDYLQTRAYYLGALGRLLYDIGGEPDAVSLLPSEMNAKVLCADLCIMQSGPGGLGAGQPQILYSQKKGEIPHRKWARHEFVAAIFYRVARFGQKPEKQFNDLGFKDLHPKTWEGWLRETPDDTIGRAKADGAARKDSSIFNHSPERICELYDAARNATD